MKNSSVCGHVGRNKKQGAFGILPVFPGKKVKSPG